MSRYSLWLGALALLSSSRCSEKAPPAAGSGAPAGLVSASASAAHGLQAYVPNASAWTQVTFAEMKLRYRRPPMLVPDAQAMIAGAQSGKAGEQVWGMSVKTRGGLDLVLLELKIAGPERARWLSDFKAGTIAGEVIFEDADAVVKRSRVVGKKANDAAPALSNTHVDMRACKRLGESEYCFDIDGGVELALGRSGVDPASAMDLVAMVRSLERPAAVK